MTMAKMDDIAARVRNWGRWGKDDQLGTLNLITPERLVAAAGLVRSGKAFDLGIPLDQEGPQQGGDRVNPVHTMSALAHPGWPVAGADREGGPRMRYAEDYLMLATHGATHWDALSHIHYEGRMYNDVPAAEVNARGAQRNAISAISKVVGRGVLLDVARSRGVDWLDAGDSVGHEELEAIAAAQGVEIKPGDILLIRTGWWSKFHADGDRDAALSSWPGIAADCVEWLHEREIAAVAADNVAVESEPGSDPELVEEEAAVCVLHMLLVRDMGMTLGEWFDLDELAADCAADGVYEFLLTAQPLKITGGAGSPLNPLAIK
jgi:kynurenine formamidase